MRFKLIIFDIITSESNNSIIETRSVKWRQELKVLFLRIYSCSCIKNMSKHFIWGINRIAMKIWSDLRFISENANQLLIPT